VSNIDDSDASDSASDNEHDSDECEDMQKVSKFMREVLDVTESVTRS
jgi:hypothetical protein